MITKERVQAEKWKIAANRLYHRCGPHYVFADCKKEMFPSGHRRKKTKEIMFNSRLRAMLKRMSMREIKEGINEIDEMNNG